MKLLNFKGAELLLKEIADSGDKALKYRELSSSDPQDRLSYLRSGAVAVLVKAAVMSFCMHHESILRGNFLKDLLSVSPFQQQTDAIRKTCRENIYNEKKKLQIEAAGYNMIMELMNLYGEVLLQHLDRGEDKLDRRNHGLFQLLPLEFRQQLNSQDPYISMLVLVDYISGMTDRYILDLYQQLTGCSVSIGRMS